MLRKTLIAAAAGALLAGGAYAAPPERYTADLQAFNAAGQPVITDAFGKAVVEVVDDGTALQFRVDVKKILNLLMAHIHIKPLGPGGESCQRDRV